VGSRRLLGAAWLAWALRISRPGRDLSRRFLQCKARMRDLEAKTPPSVSLISNVKDVDNAIGAAWLIRLNDRVDNAIPINDGGYFQRSIDGRPPPPGPGYGNAPVPGMRSELLAILSELRYITKKIKDDLESDEER